MSDLLQINKKVPAKLSRHFRFNKTWKKADQILKSDILKSDI